MAFCFRIARPQGVFVLDGCHWLNGVGTPDRPRARLRQAEVPDLAFADQLLDGAGNVFDRHVRINTVLIEQIDVVGPEPFERGLSYLLNVRRPAIEPRKGVNVESEFGGNHHLLAEGSNSFANQLFVRERTVNFGGVEEYDPAVDSRPNQ